MSVRVRESSSREQDSVSQQLAIAQFGEFALKADDLDKILQEACRLVSGAFGSSLVKVMELQPDGRTLLVRAGVGWRPGVVGAATVDINEQTAEYLALKTGEPVLSSDIATETRFEYPDFIREHGVVSLATVIIVGADSGRPYGVLQVDGTEPRVYSDADTQFLRGYANLLAAAVERHRILGELRRQAEEKGRLLMELQHRVKNNLHTVMVLLRRTLRKVRSEEAAAALRTVGDGIEALRLIHDKIYHAGGGSDRTCLGSYLSTLMTSLLAFHGDDVPARIKLATDIERVDVTSDVAIPCGLIASEFVTNSMKYAFPDGKGTIGLRVRGLGSDIEVTLWDDGAGLPAETSGGTGMSLINGLANQVGGSSTWAVDGGTRLSVRVPFSLDAA